MDIKSRYRYGIILLETMIPRLCIFFCLLSSAYAMFQPHFAKFIRQKYGRKVMWQLQRADLGREGGGSFGGGQQPSKHRPILFVHGLRDKAGVLWNQRKIFTQSGWPSERLLATSYGPGVINPQKAVKETLKCAYVKQVRKMIIATSAYYKSKIDIIAYSMGSPITRKAILGGRCVDTGENLGHSLTNKVNTYLSVAGANWGSSLCLFPTGGICNKKNGLSCSSKFIKDINARQGYEGAHRYSLASTSDEIVGHFGWCGKKSGELKGGQQFWKNGLNHESVIFKTIPEQVKIIQTHG